MTLEDKRKEWEQGGEAVLVICDKERLGQVLVVLDFKGEFALHRYFPIGMNWEVSVDVANSSLLRCLEEVTDQNAEHYPKEGVTNEVQMPKM